MKLIEDELQDVLAQAPAGDEVFVSRRLLEKVLHEIALMRSVSGVVTEGESFDDIAARVGRHPKEEKEEKA
jgi:hypothetical protein